LRTRINFDVHAPQTIAELVQHYEDHELPRKAFASRENHKILVKKYVKPQWGVYRLSAVRTVEVEKWLESLTLAPASKTKIKACFSVLYSHAIRNQWTTFNPISKVRTSSKRVREKDILTPNEFKDLLEELSVRDQAMVLLAGSTGLRRSEMIALT
jgi:site-specific recombinase XerD